MPKVISHSLVLSIMSLIKKETSEGACIKYIGDTMSDKYLNLKVACEVCGVGLSTYPAQTQPVNKAVIKRIASSTHADGIVFGDEVLAQFSNPEIISTIPYGKNIECAGDPMFTFSVFGIYPPEVVALVSLLFAIPNARLDSNTHILIVGNTWDSSTMLLSTHMIQGLRECPVTIANDVQDETLLGMSDVVIDLISGETEASFVRKINEGTVVIQPYIKEEPELREAFKKASWISPSYDLIRLLEMGHTIFNMAMLSQKLGVQHGTTYEW